MYKSFIKPAGDVFVSAIALVILSPLFLLIGLAIKISSPGPVFFRQIRIGKDMRNFGIYKFRTMVVNNQIDSYTTENDPRITNIGKILRITSLDELPQLINILFCEMSLIGPRPSIEREISDYGLEKFKKRVNVKPGITGLSQCMYRSNCTLRQKFLIDEFYARKVSLLLDLRIIILTFRMVLFKSNSAN